MADLDPRLEVMLHVLRMNETITEALLSFINPDNLMDLPSQIVEQVQAVLRETTLLAEKSEAYMEENK